MGAAPPAKDLSIPLIDFSPLLSPSARTRAETAEKILHAFETSGFLYLSSLPLSEETIAEVFSRSARFFARPREQKDGLSWTTPDSNRGYVSPGREKVSQGMTVEEVLKDRENNPDLKESMEIGREGVEGFPNRWPDEADEEGRKFKEVMRRFFLECQEIHRLVMSAIAIGLGLDERFFDDYVAAGDNSLRLLHYPPVKREVFERNRGQVRAGAHTDYGTITLLFQDNRGGLQVQTKAGEWKDVAPIEGTAVINAGDLLARWSNDKIRSTMHRVVEPPVPSEGDEYPARYSVVYFCNPDDEKTIDALPGTYGNGVEKKYPQVNAKEYLTQRLAATY